MNEKKDENESPVRRELNKVHTPLAELREWRAALALQTMKMHDAAAALEKHRLSGSGANRWIRCG